MKIVEFDTAVKLKKAGFDLYALRYYSPKKHVSTAEDYMSPRLIKSNWNDGKGSYLTAAKSVKCSAPYQYEVVDWLREAHNIEIRINPLYTESGKKKGYSYTTFNSAKSMIEKELEYISGDSWYIKNHSEALEQGILEALKLIK